MDLIPERWNPKRRHAIIDGDIIAYSSAWAVAKQNSVKAVLKASKEMLLNIRETLELDDATIHLSGSSNFRYEIYPQYKAGRKEKPPAIDEVRKYLIKYWDAVVSDGVEADDAMAIEATTYPDRIIATKDKDLNQVPGWKYNWAKYAVSYISSEEADYNLWLQVLTGDSTDNIKGIPGIGPIKGKKILEMPHHRGQLGSLVEQAYLDHGLTKQDFELNYKLVYLIRE